MTTDLRTDSATQRARPWATPLLWTVAAASVISHVATVALHLPQGVGGALIASTLTLFGLLHGALTYGLRGILIFLLICLGVSNAFENLSIMTGFPFGWYHYSDALGPKLFLVPLLIGPAYFGMGYLSWALARAILGDEDGRLLGLRSFATPVIASFIMVSWDLTIDPMASTINGSWVWRDGGSYFGVPVSNFLGWYLTVYVFFQSFALYARSRSASDVKAPGYWITPLLAYTSIIIAPVLSLILNTEPSTVLADPVGHQWQTHDIRSVEALVCLFTALPFWILAVFKTGAAGRPGNHRESPLTDQ
ncbi:MAG: carotenoid biosynthesis protein [Roseiarcus sp.]|jgi:putative membrane protein|uniref:carotenoid biosynthesis protein n=1 Tax=Roseiarcus sp. TaxID=1969460 RepID=UPI003C292EAF